MLFAIEKVITRLEWRVDPFSDDSQDGDISKEDKEVAVFVQVIIAVAIILIGISNIKHIHIIFTS